MSYKVELSEHFKKDAKRLARKYASLKEELAELFTQLENDPTLGTPLGNDIYKIRLAIASKNKGKSGGARVISFVQINDSTILLLSIYNKGEKDTISDSEIQQIINNIL
ncbi:type II toxin-antitoxin system RelE/ParE family toxin [Halpernia sp.]|uniref:type II toxin-antitoxin system RelE/ParE family toxin n=1 Tax=Halpernia sp. TaxID=2782209 RepID=UPI003A8DB40F